MYLRIRKLWKPCCCLLTFFAIIGIYVFYYIQVPSKLNIPARCEQQLSLGIPASATIRSTSGTATTMLDKPVTFLPGENYATYQMNVKLLGIIPLKNVEIQVVDEQQVCAMGVPIGIYLKTSGVMVIDVGSFVNQDGTRTAPSEAFLREGDYILRYNSIDITSKKQFQDLMKQNQGEQVTLHIRRDFREMDVTIMPEKESGGTYKLGIWIRDNAQGVGTLTYLKEDGSFGALGHGITDSDTGKLLQLGRGSLYETTIIGIRKGSKGQPGELSGMIAYDDEYIIGQIAKNTECGIYGTMNMQRLLSAGNSIGGIKKEGDSIAASVSAAKSESMTVAMKQEIEASEAQIYCCVEGKRKAYDVRIDVVHLGMDAGNKGMEITVTDPELLKVTGGIVQGLSGAPIVQNGKLVGAVTHVFVDDPTRGYGIFAETMLDMEK